ncbi:hypothetical protein WJX74_008578 [Apatococcus lobatus]|uniref:rRNA methyltransferase 2, mitochondrial n=1 Tax=Apatococcus lobatus TaxID=904363 RepID=A0AAW1SBJ4_9CHLO
MAKWQDHVGLLAKAHKYVARSAFKLLQIQKRSQLIHPGDWVLDLGCSPGAWLQVACQLLGPLHCGGSVIGIDIKDTALPLVGCDDRVMAIKEDVRTMSHDDFQYLCPGGFHVVLSDMCHNTTGNAMLDAARSLQLGQLAAEVALGEQQSFSGGGSSADDGISLEHHGVLQENGNLLIKLLQGSGSQEFAKQLRPQFRKVLWMRPEASRRASREMYVLGLGRRYACSTQPA